MSEQTGALTGVARVDAKIRVVQRDRPEPCWEWAGADDGERGYGRMEVGGRTRGTHRFVYELLRGQVPDGLVLDHLCRNPPCCNPDHLEVVTVRENNRRGAKSTMSGLRAPAEKCAHGHQYTPENTYMRNGVRKGCKECARARSAEHYRTKRSGADRVPCATCGRLYHPMTIKRHERDVHGLAN